MGQAHGNPEELRIFSGALQHYLDKNNLKSKFRILISLQPTLKLILAGDIHASRRKRNFRVAKRGGSAF